MKKFCITALAAFCSLCCVTGTAWSWSSTTMGGDALATHEYLNERAYDQLEKHPAFGHVYFPSRAMIREYASVNSSGHGKGPDDENNSEYARHYYNPRNAAAARGMAPRSVQEHFDELKKALVDVRLLREAGAKEGERALSDAQESAALNAAYSAHYIQDMTCSFHVIGTYKKLITVKEIPRADVTGPYHKWIKPPFWSTLVRRSNTEKSEKANWFEANYYDGPPAQFIMGSTHFVYEGLIEYKNLMTIGSTTTLIGMEREPDYWKPGMSMERLAQVLAEKTRNELDAHNSPWAFDADAFQETMFGVQTSLYGSGYSGGVKTSDELVEELKGTFSDAYDFIRQSAVLSSVTRVLGSDINITPHRLWSRAIQATYSVWRGSFSALYMQKEDVRLVKVAGKKDEYQLRVRVRNLEPDEPVDNVKIAFKATVKGAVAGEGSGNIGTISKFDREAAASGGDDLKGLSEWVELSGTVRIEGLMESGRDLIVPEGLGAKITFEITGQYKLTPDAGTALFEVPMDKVRVVAVKLLEVIGLERVKAIEALKSQSRHFTIEERIKGYAPSYNKEHLVAEQAPDENSWVAPDEKITLREYDVASQEVLGTVCSEILETGTMVLTKKKNPVSGAKITVNAPDIQKEASSDQDGAFALSFDDRPRTAKPQKVQVSVTHKDYQPFKAQMNLVYQARWDIVLKPNQKAAIDARIENARSEQSMTAGATWWHWNYDIVLRPRNAGIVIREMVLEENGRVNKESLVELVTAEAGGECRLNRNSDTYYTADPKGARHTIKLLGEDFNGNPVEVTLVFPDNAADIKVQEPAAAQDGGGFGERPGSWEQQAEAEPPQGVRAVSYEGLQNAGMQQPAAPLYQPQPVRQGPAYQPQPAYQSQQNRQNTVNNLGAAMQGINQLIQMQTRSNQPTRPGGGGSGGTRRPPDSDSINLLGVEADRVGR